MEIRVVSVGEADPQKLKAYFDVQALDGSPALYEEGKQPQISINGGEFNPTGISLLVASGYGLYHASLDPMVLTSEGDIIRTRYASGATRETRGDTFQVVDPHTGFADPTSGAVSNVSYATVAEGDAYFAMRLNAAPWSDSSFDDREKSLIEASQRVSRLNFAGEKSDPAQVLQFPRKNVFQVSQSNTLITDDSGIPADIKIACFLVAYKLLDGWEPDTEDENLTKVRAEYSQVRAFYERGFVPPYIKAGIPSAEAWSYLRPYLLDPGDMTLTRVN